MIGVGVRRRQAVAVVQNILLVLLLATMPPGAQADWLHRLIGYTCDEETDQLTIYYVHAYNELGAAMRETKGPDAWDPGEFVASMKDDDHIGELRTVDRECKLKHGSYQIRFGATPGNYNIQGRCGAVITAWVQVRRGNKLVLPAYEMEGDCHDMSAPITTQIVFTADLLGPTFTKVSPDDLFR